MAQLVCGGCHTVLMYKRGATRVKCSWCYTVTHTPLTEAERLGIALSKICIGEILSSGSVTHTPLREAEKLEISLPKSWIDENKLVATKPGKSWQGSIVYPFWKSADEDPRRGRDGLSWYKDAGRHAYGDFSMAIVQANNLLEDQCQIESGSHGTFVGIYDGHGGPETSRFVTENLFHCMKNIASEHQGMSDDVIKQAFLSTEEEFLGLVRKQWLTKPQMASVGSCCLVGVICNGTMYIANAGDSRVVLGRSDKTSKDVKAMQLSTEHNVSLESVREELRSTHPDDSDIVVLKHNVWRVKGIIQISRSIGDAYLKNAEFNKEPLPRFRLVEPFSKPILMAEPTVLVEKLTPQDQFLIFASDGLWEHLTNQEAVHIVNHNTRHGIARRLVKAALHEAAKKHEMRYTDLIKIDRRARRHFHDDITVVVLFLEANLISKTSFPHSELSLRGWSGVTQ